MNLNFRAFVKTTRVALPAACVLTALAISGSPGYAEPIANGAVATDWLVLGPIPVFPGPADAGDEAAQRRAFQADDIDVEAQDVTEGKLQRLKDTEYRWTTLAGPPDGFTDLTALNGESDFAMAYAWTQIDAPAATKILLGLGSDDAVKVWVNGKSVHERWGQRPWTLDEDLVPLQLREGPNTILLKLQNRQWAWGFSARALGPDLLTEKLLDFARRGDLDALGLLLDHGANPNAEGRFNLTALQMARVYGREQAQLFLIERGATAASEMPSRIALTDAFMKSRVAEDEPGYAVLVASKGEEVYAKGFGLADLSHRTPITTTTKFRIGSITKQFTAAAILALQEDGLLNIDNPLSRYIPGFPRGDEVTLRHLLTHTSGIHDFTGLPGFLDWVTSPITVEEMITLIGDTPYDFDPGSDWRYSSSGYFLLGYVVAFVADVPYGDYLKEQFLGPLELHDTGVHRGNEVLASEATGYAFVNGRIEKAPDWDMSWAGGAGALYSTAEDLMRWSKAVFSGEVFSAETYEAVFGDAEWEHSRTMSGDGGSRSFGWSRSVFRGHKVVGHGSGISGFVSYTEHYPDDDLTVVVLSNFGPPRDLEANRTARLLGQLFLWDVMEPQASFSVDLDVPASTFDDYVGRYAFPGGTVLEITRDGDRLMTQVVGQSPAEIYPHGENAFFWKAVDAHIVFLRDPGGTVVGARHHQYGLQYEAGRIEDETPVTLDTSGFDKLVGSYEFSPGTSVALTRNGNRLFLQVSGQPAIEMFARSENEFFVRDVVADITVQDDPESGTTTLTVTRDGIRHHAVRQ